MKKYFEDTEKPKFFLTDVFSWRGIYAEVAFTPSKTGTREESLALIERALTERFCGYKGDVFTYNVYTNVHFELERCEFDDMALYNLLLED